MSKCVYLASMGVKINHTVGSQNQEFFVVVVFVFFQNAQSKHGPQNKEKKCENLCFCPSKRNGIHGKLKKIEFGRKFCHICHLGRRSAIIIDVLFVSL